MTKYVGFTGQARAGKTTAAHVLRDVMQGDVVVCSFADPMRAMLMALYEAAGIDPYDALAFLNDYKSVNVPIMERSSRELLQTLGTEWGRDCVKQNLWVDIAMRERPEDVVVFDDVRFDNEADAIRKAGGLIVHVHRETGEARMAHSSENGVTWRDVDYELCCDIDHLRDAMIEIAAML